MKKILLTGMLLCLTASMALAAGLNFNWSSSIECPAVQTSNQTFACNSNSAPAMYMVGSFVANVAVPGFNAMDIRIDGQSVGDVPAWWHGFDALSCRGAGAFTSAVPPNPPTVAGVCSVNATNGVLWLGLAPFGGIGAWVYDAPNRFHTVIGFAAGGNRATNLSIIQQFNAFNAKVMTSNTVYVAPDPTNEIDEVLACAGCLDGVTFVLNQINLFGSGVGDQITQPIAPPASQCITWQGGAGAGVCGATPARNTTWGQVKSLYR